MHLDEPSTGLANRAGSLEYGNTSRISGSRRNTDGRAPDRRTSLRSDERSTSPESAIHIPGIGDPLQRNTHWADVVDSTDGDGLLVTVRRSRTNQEGEVNDVRFVQDSVARALRTLRAATSPEPGDRVVPLSAQMIGLRFTAAARAAGVESRVTAHSGRGGLASELTSRGASTNRRHAGRELEDAADGGPLLCRGDCGTRCHRSLPVTAKGSRTYFIRQVHGAAEPRPARREDARSPESAPFDPALPGGRAGGPCRPLGRPARQHARPAPGYPYPAMRS